MMDAESIGNGTFEAVVVGLEREAFDAIVPQRIGDRASRRA